MTKTAHRFTAHPLESLSTSKGELHHVGLFCGSYVTSFYGDTAEEALSAASAEAYRLNARVRDTPSLLAA